MGACIWAAWYFAIFAKDPTQNGPVVLKDEHSNVQSVAYKTEVVAQDLSVPWGIAFSSPTRILVSERTGSIRVIENGQKRAEPLVVFNEVSTGGEEGLMGLVLDPSYNSNRYIYTCLAYQTPTGMRVKVVRVTDKGQSANEQVTILEGIPAARFHAGCELGFGPDSKLYISTGDSTDKNIAQDQQSLGGKILRINRDGTIPSDNPFKNSPVWSYGHRNPQGLCWQPGTNQLFSVEHGPSGFDGPLGGDELNRIDKGANYGWPLVSHTNTKAGAVSPLIVFTPAVAPAACTFYSSNIIPQFNNSLIFAALRGEGLYRVVFSKDNPKEIAKYEKLSDINVGRLREVVQGPDGALYFTTSNTDGRGTPQPGDDKILKIVPR